MVMMLLTTALLLSTWAMLFLLIPLPTVVDASQIVSESRTRLPMSLSTVISDLEAEGMEELSTACVITSRSVTSLQKQHVLDTMIDGQDEHLSASSSKAVATMKGLVLALPSSTSTLSLEEVVQSIVACQGIVIYIPSTVDLQRGEGLMDALLPAMERLLQWQTSQQKKQNQDGSNGEYQNHACLVVVCETEDAIETTKQQLEAAAAPLLDTLSSSSSHHDVSNLQDVFGSVLYLTADKVESALLNHEQRPLQTVTPENAMALVASVVAEESNLFAPLTSLTTASTTEKIRTIPKELAAARQLEPAKRQAVTNAMKTVTDATNNNSKLVVEFGALCDAALQQAKDQFVIAAATASTLAKKGSGTGSSGSGSTAAASTFVGKDLAYSLQQELASEWMDVYEKQLELLSESSFDSFREGLQTLRITANLANDMERIAQESITKFTNTVKKLIPTKLPSSSLMGYNVWKSRATDTKMALGRRLREYNRDRLLNAEAQGKFRPIPRKGVTIGMHWLLPKPFGNDYRQEPWMVHATDNLVYVPRRSSKVTDVPEEDVKTGDWRDQIVPSPAGRDMLFMQ